MQAAQRVEGETADEFQRRQRLARTRSRTSRTSRLKTLKTRRTLKMTEMVMEMGMEKTTMMAMEKVMKSGRSTRETTPL